MDLIRLALPQQQIRRGAAEPGQWLGSEPCVGRERRASLHLDTVQNLEHLAEPDLGLPGPDPRRAREGVPSQTEGAGDLSLGRAQLGGDQHRREELILDEFLETHDDTSWFVTQYSVILCDVVEARLVDAGVHVLTMDLRGFGESAGAGIREAGGFPPFLQTATGDVDMAFDYLRKQERVDTGRMGAGGASCGAMLTADLAARRPVKALMLLSGPPSAEAVANMAARSDLAVFGAAATGDTITGGVAGQLQGAVDGSKHPSSTAKIYDGTEHGLPMFEKNADLEPALVSWLKMELVGK